MKREEIRVACFLVQEQYKAGDPAPKGYLALSEWAEVQYKAGLRQKQCGRCGKWKFPQEMSDIVDTCQMTTRKGGGQKVTIQEPVCLVCKERG